MRLLRRVHTALPPRPTINPQTPTAAHGSAGPTAPAPRGDTNRPPDRGLAAHHAATSAASRRAWSGTSADPAESLRASAGPRSRAPSLPRTRTLPPRAPSRALHASADEAQQDPSPARTPPRRNRAVINGVWARTRGNSGAPKPGARPRPARPTASRRIATRAGARPRTCVHYFSLA